MKVIKRNGSEETFTDKKIQSAIEKANLSVEPKYQLSPEKLKDNAARVAGRCRSLKRAVNVEEIQDIVEEELMRDNAFKVAKAYITYRYTRANVRTNNNLLEKIKGIVEYENEEIKQENSNKDPQIASTQRDYMAGEVSKELFQEEIPEEIVSAHKNGLIHFHDTDYFAQHIHNCDLINLYDMLMNGTVISGTKIDKPHSFLTACNIATQIVAQVASSQYGGQTFTLTHLAPFVDISRKRIRKEVEEECGSFIYQCIFGRKMNEPTEGLSDMNSELYAEYNKQIDAITEKRVRDEIKHGVQTIQYQINTLQTTNGQTPFVTVFMYLNEAQNEQEKQDLALIIEEVLKQRIIGTKNEKGVWTTPAFPKLIYALEEDNIHKDSKYYYLTELAAKCTAKRLVPDYISEKKMKELKGGYCFPSMGCRSFLSPTDAAPGKFYGRFNKGVVTINLIDVACSAIGEDYNKDMESFWSIFDDRLENLCHKALLCRYERLKGTKSDIAPILWQHGALARLQPGETIDKYLTGGYSSISLGYAGLWETVYELTGKTLLTDDGRDLGLKILQHMNDKCDEWNKELNLGYGIYGSPIESTTYKFAQCLQKRFGIIEGVTDKNYITNSYHVKVTEEIDAFSKLTTESQFQALSTGGSISYVEVPNLQNNIPAVLAVIQHIYDNIMYAELNTKSDFCMKCSYDGEIKIVEEDGKLVWECPNCGCRDQTFLSVVRRTCGYLGTNFWNQGRTQEIKERVLHL